MMKSKEFLVEEIEKVVKAHKTVDAIDNNICNITNGAGSVWQNNDILDSLKYHYDLVFKLLMEAREKPEVSNEYEVFEESLWFLMKGEIYNLFDSTTNSSVIIKSAEDLYDFLMNVENFS